MIVDPASGDLWLYPGTANGGWAAKQRIGVGWGVANLIVGGHDWNGDDTTDLLMRRHDGTLWLYPGNGRGGFGTPRQVGTGWNAMSSIAMVGTSATGARRSSRGPAATSTRTRVTGAAGSPAVGRSSGPAGT